MLLLLIAAAALPWAPMRAETGEVLRLTEDNPWDNGPYLPLVANVRNGAGLYPETIHEASVRALQRWGHATDGLVRWDYWQGSDSRDYPVGQHYDGVSTLSFSSAAGVDLGARAAAHTQLWSDPETGEVVEVDILLNDLWFGFTDDHDLTTYGDEGFFGHVLGLEDVLVHELGHALGLSHSGLAHSSMFTMSWAGQAQLGCDDVAGIQAIYGVQAPESRPAGTARGAVYGTEGGPLFGAQVTLISWDRAAPVAATLTEPDGSWEISGLEPGEYYVLAEPYLAGAAALSDYYEHLDHGVCADGRPFSRTFAVSWDGRTLEPVPVRAGEIRYAPPLWVTCAEEGGADVLPLPEAGHALVPGVAQVVAVHPGPDHLVDLIDVEGELTVDLLTWSLFSPVAMRARLNGPDGKGIYVDDGPAWEDEETGYVSWDTTMLLELPERGDYTLELSSGRLSPELYPLGDVYVDPTPYVVAMARHGERHSDPECETDPLVFTPYTSPFGAPARWDLAEDPLPTGCSSTGLATMWLGWLALLPLVGRRR